MDEEIFWSLTALGLFIVFVITASLFFFSAILTAVINGTILYFLFIKANADIRKRKMLSSYMISALVALIFLSISGNMFPVWSFTTWAMITMFFVVIIRVIRLKKIVLED